MDVTTTHHRTSGGIARSDRADQRVAQHYRTAAHKSRSVEQQEAAVRAYLDQHPEWQVVATFRDAATSGTRSRRPGLSSALRPAARGDFDILLVTRLDDLSRHLGHRGDPRQPRQCLGDSSPFR